MCFTLLGFITKADSMKLEKMEEKSKALSKIDQDSFPVSQACRQLLYSKDWITALNIGSGF